MALATGKPSWNKCFTFLPLSTRPKIKTLQNEDWGVGHTQYSARNIYDQLRDSSPKVSCHKVFWFKREIPKHHTLTWMVQLNCLPTWDRLLSKNIPTDPNCLLCNHQLESRDHILFEYNYSGYIWMTLALSFDYKSCLKLWIATLD